MAKSLFTGGRVLVRRFGNPVIEIDNTETAVRSFLLKNCPPNWDYTNEDEIRPARIPETTETKELLKIAEEKKFTFDFLK